jgi:hypothetical protein
MRLKTMVIFGAGYFWGSRLGLQKELLEKSRSLLETQAGRVFVDRAATAVEGAVGKVPHVGPELQVIASSALGGPTSASKPSSSGQAKKSTSSRTQSSERKPQSQPKAESKTKSSNGTKSKTSNGAKKSTTTRKSVPADS